MVKKTDGVYGLKDLNPNKKNYANETMFLQIKRRKFILD